MLCMLEINNNIPFFLDKWNQGESEGHGEVPVVLYAGRKKKHSRVSNR